MDHLFRRRGVRRTYNMTLSPLCCGPFIVDHSNFNTSILLFHTAPRNDAAFLVSVIGAVNDFIYHTSIYTKNKKYLEITMKHNM